MPDISMCANKTCDKRLTCYRYRARPNEHWQSYANFDAEDCEHYWAIDASDLKNIRTVDELELPENK